MQKVDKPKLSSWFLSLSPLKERKTINQVLEQIQLFISDEIHHLISIFCFFFQCSAQLAKFNFNNYMFDKMSNSQMQRYLSFPTSTHHPLKIPLSTLLLISLLLMIKNYLLNCLSYLQSNPKFRQTPIKINSWFENICFKKNLFKVNFIFYFL